MVFIKFFSILQIELLDTVKRALIDDKPDSFQDCVSYARNFFQLNYNNVIRQMLFNFPPDEAWVE